LPLSPSLCPILSMSSVTPGPFLRAAALAASALLLTWFALPAAPAAQASRAPAEVRGLWVTRTWMTSPQKVAQVVDDAARHGITTLFVQVRGRGDAFYLGGPEPRAVLLAAQPAFDPLAELLARAHAKGLQVHAWLNVNLVAGYIDLPKSSAHVIRQRPDLLMVPRDLVPALHAMAPTSAAYVAKLADWSQRNGSQIEGLFLSPIPEDAHAHQVAVVEHLVRHYALDGLHLDYIRYPGPDFDYSRAALTAFRDAVALDLTAAELARLDARAATAPLAFVDHFPQRWASYRRERLTTLVERIRTTLREARPDALLTAAVWPDAGEATARKQQDWPAWLGTGLVQAVLPMMYTTSSATFGKQLEALAVQPRGTVWPGLGVYRIPAAEAARRVRAARAAGFSGVVLFSYDSMTGGPGRASPYMAALQREVFQTPPTAARSSAR
jgi:uncharacterized lipoprotein YddW (UPF0748 family)